MPVVKTFFCLFSYVQHIYQYPTLYLCFHVLPQTIPSTPRSKRTVDSETLIIKIYILRKTFVKSVALRRKMLGCMVVYSFVYSHFENTKSRKVKKNESCQNLHSTPGDRIVNSTPAESLRYTYYSELVNSRYNVRIP